VEDKNQDTQKHFSGHTVTVHDSQLLSLDCAFSNFRSLLLRRHLRILAARDIQRAHALPANGIVCIIELASKLESWRGIQYLEQRMFAYAPQHTMKKAGANVACGIDDGRNPGSVAARRLRGDLGKVGAKMSDNAPQFFGTFHHKSGSQLSGALAD